MNSWIHGIHKTVIKGKFTVLKIFPKQNENKLNLKSHNINKSRNCVISRKREILKIREETNEKKTEK